LTAPNADALAVARCLSYSVACAQDHPRRQAGGIGKSSALKVLAGHGFYCDTPLDLGTNGACQATRGVWIYEIPELPALLRGNLAHGKAFLTSAHDHFRTPYSRIAETVPRSVVFCGSIVAGSRLARGRGWKSLRTPNGGHHLLPHGVMQLTFTRRRHE